MTDIDDDQATVPDEDGIVLGEDADPESGSRRDRRREWRRAEKARRKEARKSVRFPIITRSILIWWLIFVIVGVTAGLTAAYFWSNFNAQVSELEAENAGLQETINQAKAEIDTQRTQTLDEINQALAPLEDYADEGIKTAEHVGIDPNAVWFVNTLDAEGKPSVGSAVVVATNENESILLTSFNVVREAAILPGPEIRVSSPVEELPAELWNWDEAQDLALIKVPKPGLPVVPWASEEEAAEALGKRVFAVGGLGGEGLAAVPGLVVDQSASGLQHTVPVGTAFQGAPIVTGGGRLLAVGSLTYQPLGFNPGAVRFAVPIGRACASVLACGGGVILESNEGQVGEPDPNAAPPTQD